MKLVCAAGWVAVGVVLTAGAYAQEAASSGGSDARLPVESVAGKQGEIEAREKPLKEADAFLKAGKPAEAYALLEPLEFERSGEVRFDYLLGISALDSGKPDKATLAFERLLAVDPNFAGARLDMARAYYQLGDMLRAKTEFELVMGQNPPEAARVTIQKYLDAIAAYEQAKLTRVSAYVEAGVGHDTNSNSATNEIKVGSFVLDSSSRKSPDDYAKVAAGGDINHVLDANWAVYLGGDVRKNAKMVLTQYDAINVDGRMGVMYGQEQNVYRLTMTGGQAYTANSMRRNSQGLNLEWQHTFDSADQLSAFAQYGRNRAAGAPPTSLSTSATIEGDTNLVAAGAGWLHVLADGKQVLFGSIFAGKEFDVAPPTGALVGGGRPDGNKRFEGLRVGGQAAIFDHLDGVVSLGWVHSVYGQPNTLISNEIRNEKQVDLVLGANWNIDDLWVVKPEFVFSKKVSNLPVFSFDRMDVSLTIRRNFR